MADSLAGFLSASVTGEFQPQPFHEKHTDSLIFYARDERSFGKRINQQFTLFLSVTDHTLVGCEVKGVSRMCRHLGDFDVLVIDDEIKLGILIGIASSSPESDEASEALRREMSRLRQMTDDVPVHPSELLSI